MPQKPQDRAREKRRLTKRLANWRAKQELPPPPPPAAPAQEAAKKAEAKPKK